MKIRILLVDDHMIIRQGLRSLLEKHDGISIIAEAEDGAAAIREATALRPDIVIMDISMPQINGVDAARRIVSEIPEVKIIALSIHSDGRFIVNMLNRRVAYLRRISPPKSSWRRRMREGQSLPRSLHNGTAREEHLCAGRDQRFYHFFTPDPEGKGSASAHYRGENVEGDSGPA
jgi:DNA-binding NarL/FixJ family response regulator